MHVRCYFHPVGQGIFSTGELIYHGRSFHWVYDCGTASKQIFLNKQIDWALQPKPARSRFDLAVLSHFDKDHLSGFVELLTRSTVKTLLLPYIPFAYRLVLAIESRASASSDLVQFLMDPVGFFGNRERFQVESILLVPGRNGPPADDAPPSPVEVRPDPDDRQRKQNNPEPSNAETGEEVAAIAQYDAATQAELDTDERLEYEWHQKNPMQLHVEFLRPHSGLTVEEIWEFFPYNDIIPNKRLTAAFIYDVEKSRSSLLTAPSDEALKAVRNLYDRHFGKTGKMRNAISLFMYAGTVVEPTPYFRDSVCVQYVGTSPSDRCSTGHLHLANSGIIYTGDGYLKTGEQIVRFASAIGRERLGRKNFLQVMHHGSKNNSHPSIARFLSPIASIYCSDPANNRFNHPHYQVTKQFSPYTPMQVDLVNGVRIRFQVHP